MTHTIQWISTTPQSQWLEEEDIQKDHPDKTVAPNLTVTDNERQTWFGFGACFNELEWLALNRLEPDTRESILQDFFQPGYECQFNFCRIPVGANDYSASWYSLNETPADYDMKHFSIERDKTGLIPFIKSAQHYCPDLKLFASPWSPPTWMKEPPVYNFGVMIWEEKVLKAYALYLLKFVEGYAKEGIPITQLHVQNEPVSDQKFPSCIWKGEQLKIFIRDYLGPLFTKHGVPTEIWLGTINGPEVDERYLYTTYNDYANLVLHDEAARQYIKGVGYQWRGKYAVQRTRQGWPELPVIQTENECGDGTNSWEYAAYVFDLFYHYITNDVIAYVYWNMVLPPKGESTWGWKQNSLITVNPKTTRSGGAITFNPEYFVMKHFSKFIKPGFKRIELTGEWSANAVAFKNQKTTVIVIHNPFKNPEKIHLNIDQTHYQFCLKPESFNSILLKA
jgi:glucosylceramidase